MLVFCALGMTATPLGALSNQRIDLRNTVAKAKVQADEFARGIETHGLSWLFMKPVEKLSVQGDPQLISAITRTVGAQLSVSPELLNGVIASASQFDPLYVSDSDAMGLMLITKDDALKDKLSSPFDPWQNITSGARKLRQFIERENGSWERALGGYYRSAGIVDDKANRRLVNNTLEAYRREVAKRYPSLS